MQSEQQTQMVPLNMLKTSSNLLMTVPRRISFVDFFCYLWFMFVFLTLSCLFLVHSPVITCWERADLLALLCVVFSCVCVTFPYGVPCQVRYLIVSVPDLCLSLFFNTT